MVTDSNKLIKHIFMSVIMIVSILLALMLFMRTNNERIISQNENYVADATILSAGRVNDRIETALDCLDTVASMGGSMLDSPEVDMEMIAAVSNVHEFDRMEFIPADGQFAIGTETVDLSDTEAYIKGMQGKTGVSVGHLAEETMFFFYTPLYFEGELTGVLCGLYGEKSMQEVIEGEYFGMTAKTYLCAGDGTVITATGVESYDLNILEAIEDSSHFTQNAVNEITDAFKEHKSASFNFNRKNAGVESAYIAALDCNDWMLVQGIPAEVTDGMRSKANYAGVVLVGCIIFAFLIYILFLLVTYRRSEQHLIRENKEISNIVESVITLFTRFAVVDLKNDSYYYVERSDGIPPKGKYSDLMEYMKQYYVKDDDSVDMMEVVSPEHIREHMTEDVDYLQYEYRINRKTDMWENVSLICLKREGGKPVSMLYAVQNITERKRKELESRIALKNAFDSAKAANSAKSEFLSRMSHDIRTPMNAVMGMTAVASMHLDDRERLVDCLNKISTSSRHLLALINDILDMSKIESGKVTLSEEPFNMAEMTESILTIMHPQIKAKDQKISMSTSNIVHEDVIGDTLRLRQVFVNIMGNAVKFTPVGGSISLHISELESRIPGKACYEFVFSDTGIGMEQSFIDKIFEPFTRSENSDTKKIEGTGLGMPIAKNIVSMMDGDIKVESKLGEGSRFTVRLHLTIQNLSETDAHCLDALKILVADDDPAAAENTCEILNSLGMNASGVLGGEDAVAEVVKRHEQGEGYAAVILDWQMPDKNGVEATAEIREKVGKEVPIVILSAYDWTDIEQEARDKGVNAFIAKPLFRSRLVYVLRSLIAPKEQVPENKEIDRFTENKYSGKRILLVEDNELNREIACELLNMIGLEVEMAFDGKIALETITSKPAGYYDLVFMDIQMPNMNGYEATKAIRASGREDLKEIPIVAMSADAFSDDVYRAKESGMNDHISKPVEIPKLSEMLEKWLKK